MAKGVEFSGKTPIKSQNDRINSGHLSRVRIEGENREPSGEGSLVLSEQIMAY
jgi:hypothetical protein